MQTQSVYSDFGALASLRGAARQDADANLEEVASQFESLFVQMMLKSMREATMQGGLFDSHQLESYQQMHDQQLSLDIASRGGLGLAKVLVEQLQSDRGVAQSTDTSPNPSPSPDTATALPLSSAPSSQAPMGLSRYLDAPLPTQISAPDAAQTTPRKPEEDWTANTPAEFTRKLGPIAEAAANRLGVEPKVLLAQSALETGWGKYISSDQSGSSNNFFNIKAGADWSGPSVVVQTVEYRDGVAVREAARFRAYDSPADSFADYVELIQSSPRYSEARAASTSGDQYLRELQRAGYATDPAYADKILSILSRPEWALADSGLKNVANLPLEG